MKASSIAFSQANSRDYRAILWGGLAVGVLDLAAATIRSATLGRKPIGVMHSIASGLLGADAYTGGIATAALGVILHFLIAFIITTIYYVASRKLKFLVKHTIVCGSLYGITVFVVMNFIVLPLSAIPFKLSYPLRVVVIGLTIHIFCVGLPIAVAVRRYSK
ncbi:MAG: hypothetical protein AB1489_38180 [Acidobacteriota bacterium]